MAQDTTNFKKTTTIMKNTHLSIRFIASIALLVVVLSLISCFNNNVKTKELSFCSQSPSIEKLHISNKTYNKKIVANITITDASQIALFCDQINKLKKVDGKVNVKTSLGFFEVNSNEDKSIANSIEIIYTRYDGVIIDYRGQEYKNDRLESLVLAWFIEATP